MILNCLLNSLRLYADVPLCGGCAAVLQEPLDKGDVIAVRLVDLRSQLAPIRRQIVCILLTFGNLFPILVTFHFTVILSL